MIRSLFANSSARSNGILCSSRQSSGRVTRAPNTHQTPFRCIGPIFTTCLIFSLLRMPSLRPRVMPATFKSLVPLIMWLSGLGISAWFNRVDHVLRTFTSGNANSLRFDLETQASFVLPEGRRHPRFHAGRGDLAGAVKIGLRAVVGLRRRHGWEGQDISRSAHRTRHLVPR